MEYITFFNKTKNIKTQEQKFNYLKEHYTYYTINILNELINILDNATIEEEEEQITVKHKVLIF